MTGRSAAACAANGSAPAAVDRGPRAKRTPRYKFDAWSGQLRNLVRRLDVTPESEPELRETLLDDLHALEQLITDTRSSCGRAVLCKTRLLLWLAEMEGHEHAQVLADIERFVARRA